MNGSRWAAIAAVLVAGGIAWAHPPEADGQHDDHHLVEPARIRTWTNAKTGEVVRGAFLAARLVDGVVRVSIERESGDVVVFPLADLADADRAEAHRRIDEVKATTERLAAQPASAMPGAPSQAAAFNAFAPFVSTRWDKRWLYVESDGLPHMPGGKPGTYVYSHSIMVGITAWQQQVPLPQNYKGANAWRIPLQPELADKPVSAKEQLFRGAIGLAANGVPIFNPIKNDGKTDTFLAGELDEFGGHCGRADDYHYHIAPLHLQMYVGKNTPVAYALDGFPIYGLFDPAAKAGEDKACPLGGTDKLDELNGHFGAPSVQAGTGAPAPGKGLYHYHASVKYPYLNGGMRGVVTVKDDQIDPQPRASSPRAALPPLRGAKITGFKATGKQTDPAWSLEYLLDHKTNYVNYRIEDAGNDAKYVFNFVDPTGATKTDTYDAAAPQRRPGGGRGEGGGGERPRRNQPPRPDAPPPEPGDVTQKPTSEPAPKGLASAFTLTSVDAKDGRLSIDCTCDGQSRVPALKWDKPPEGTKAFAVVMHHVARDNDTHVYMVVANIPEIARELKSGETTIGTWGQNTVNRKNAYAPPCSQGPGDKIYTITLYALSAEAKLTKPLTRDTLLAAIKETTLATAPMEVKYARAQSAEQRDAARRDAQPQNPERRGEGRRGERDGAATPPNEGQRGLLSRLTAFKTDVPAYDMSVILARPTERSITVSIAVATPADAIVEYWSDGSADRLRSRPTSVKGGAGNVVGVELTGLAPGTEYRYRVGLSRDGKKTPTWGEESRFRTKPGPGTPAGFTFVVQADSHLDQGVEPKVYEQTLANMLPPIAPTMPDFMIDLGDTFMTDKRGADFKSASAQYDAQRYYFSRVAHSVPLFMVLGNHDGEKGTSGKSVDDIGPWSYAQRTSRFPPPLIDGTVGGMYTGSTGLNDGVGANYYAFEWGDALFVVLDPYWSTAERIRGGGGGTRGAAGATGQPANDEPLEPTDASWAMTLGRTQYDWLARTLEGTKAKYRFVLIHHLVGGLGGPESRGGVESSPFFEWGGKNADGTPGFAERRPGWPMPIHDLLVTHRVSAVFHGHDHLYVHSQRDGVVYQCVPQPGNPRGNTRTATQYGYASGVLHGSPGHVRVQVNPVAAAVEFVRTGSASGAEGNGRGNQGRPGAEANGAVIDQYSIAPFNGR